MDLGLKGKKAVVTGATKGIGRKIVETLADEGVDIAICSRTAEEVEETLAVLRAKGINAVGEAVNVRDGEAYKAWITRAAEQLGGIDILVPNVSGGAGMDSEKNWQRNFDVDVMGSVRAVETAVPFLKKSGEGSVVFIVSTNAIETFAAPMAYNALKASLITYSKQLGQFHGKRRIRFNALSPGPIFVEGGAWDMIKTSQPDFYNATIAAHPFGRMGSAEEVAKAVAFLASPAASWINGTHLIVDGGYTKGVHF